MTQSNQFMYNGFLVEAIGEVKKIAGGYVVPVRIVDCPPWIFDREFNAYVVDGKIPAR
jgi:hypothetical protein